MVQERSYTSIFVLMTWFCLPFFLPSTTSSIKKENQMPSFCFSYTGMCCNSIRRDHSAFFFPCGHLDSLGQHQLCSWFALWTLPIVHTVPPEQVVDLGDVRTFSFCQKLTWPLSLRHGVIRGQAKLRNQWCSPPLEFPSPPPIPVPRAPAPAITPLGLP